MNFIQESLIILGEQTKTCFFFSEVRMFVLKVIPEHK